LIDIARHAAVGVTVFFVISGFLITNLLLLEESESGKIHLGAFYVRRAFRIMPVFLLYVLFIYFWQDFENLGLNKSDFVHAFTFTVNFISIKNWYLGHLWSLSVEEQFYLMWPVILIFFRKHLKLVLIAFLFYACIARVIDYKFPAYRLISLSPFFMYADAIVVGALGGLFYFDNPEIVKNKLFNNFWLQLLALAVFLLSIYCTDYGKLAIIFLPFGNLMVAMSVLFLIFSYIKPQRNFIYKQLNSKAMAHVGILSYSIYIWQQFFFAGYSKFEWRSFPLNIAIIYPVSLASYYLWEKPFLKLRKYLQK